MDSGNFKNSYKTNLMPIARLELHYHFADRSHSMDAIVRNKCEAEALAAFVHIAHQLGVTAALESSAYKEGGLKEIWTFLGTSNAQLSFILAVIVLAFSRIPVSDPESDARNKEIQKLTIEEKKLNLIKLKREVLSGDIRLEAPAEAAELLNGDLKVATRRSNFYRGLAGYEKVKAVGFGEVLDGEDTAHDEKIVPRNSFNHFIQFTDKLPAEMIDGAQIEIVAPVLRSGNYQWKGIFQGQPINFTMLDEEFKSDVMFRKVSFQNGSTIECVLNVYKKFDEVGDITVTGYSVVTVLSKTDGNASQETAQGKRHRLSARQAAGQGRLFDATQ